MVKIISRNLMVLFLILVSCVFPVSTYADQGETESSTAGSTVVGATMTMTETAYMGSEVVELESTENDDAVGDLLDVEVQELGNQESEYLDQIRELEMNAVMESVQEQQRNTLRDEIQEQARSFNKADLFQPFNPNEE